MMAFVVFLDNFEKIYILLPQLLIANAHTSYISGSQMSTVK